MKGHVSSKSSDRPLLTFFPAERYHSDCLVLFIPGMTGNNAQWMGVIDDLPDRRIDVAVAPPILPHESIESQKPTVRDVAAALANTLVQDSYRRVVVVTHSVGAFVGFELAKILPDHIAAVIAVNGALYDVGRFLDAPWKEVKVHPAICITAARLFVLAAVPTPKRMQRAIMRSERLTRFFVGRLVPAAVMKSPDSRAILVAGSNTPGVALGLWRNRHHWRIFVDGVSKIVCPVAFVVGALDPLNTEADAKSMVRLFGDATYVVLPGTGHAAPLEAPKMISAIIANYL